MTDLIVRASTDMGPLDVTVYPPTGEPEEFAISSGAPEFTVRNAEGLYAIIAERPNGVRIRKRKEVDGKEKEVVVDLSDEIGPSLNEFMSSEAMQGQVIVKSWAKDRRATELTGFTARSLEAALSSKVYTLQNESGGVDGMRRMIEERRSVAATQQLALHAWALVNGKWQPQPEIGLSYVSSDDFLKVGVRPVAYPNRTPLALGLLPAGGLGPIVIVPPFRQTAPLHPPKQNVEVTFLASGLLSDAADRTRNPGEQRTPVALVSLANPSASDLLAALASPGTPRAGDIWRQTASNLADGAPPDLALDMLIGKFEKPAEALVAAHYLIRFLPRSLPRSWADNLESAIPEAADGPVIAAWHRVLVPSSTKGNQLKDEIEARLDRALARKTALFARTWLMLFDLLALSKEKRETEEVQLYRQYGASAGGFESFWGGAPDKPGALSMIAPEPVVRLKFSNGAFEHVTG